MNFWTNTAKQRRVGLLGGVFVALSSCQVPSGSKVGTCDESGSEEGCATAVQSLTTFESNSSPTCTEDYQDLFSAPLPSSCTQLSGADIGQDRVFTVNGFTAFVENWVSSTPGNYTGFDYRGLIDQTDEADWYVATLAGGNTYIDDGNNNWVVPGTDNPDRISSVIMCTCNFEEPAEEAACGDGLVQEGEVCDDGNTVNGDGCSADCSTVESGYVCRGIICQAAACGDGIIAGYEECEDDDVTPTSGDGCSSTCRFEAGFVCAEPGAACRAAVCGDGVVEGLESCDDGNTIDNDACSTNCTLNPDCSSGQCQPQCGDGLLFPGEACDDANLRNGDGCSDTCQLEDGFSCSTVEQSDLPQMEVAATFRDFVARKDEGGHPDFQRGGPYRVSKGLVQELLGQDGLPLYNPDGAGDIRSADSFSTWYRDSDFSLTVHGSLTLVRTGPNTLEYDNSTFFPLDGNCTGVEEPGLFCGRTGLGEEITRGANDNKQHNFHFTSEVRHHFQYRGGEQLNFRGDDDVWVFINGRLAVDIGGVHAAVPGSITLDPHKADTFGLKKGNFYEIVVFQAERQTVGSNYRLTLAGFSSEVTQCSEVCGDGWVTPGEGCDDGINDGSYGGCFPGCQAPAARCGDGVLDSDYEECDDGNLNSGDGCSSSCEIEVDCPLEDELACTQGPCADDPNSVACMAELETYCGQNRDEFACQFDECAGGGDSLSACRQAINAYCLVFTFDSRCME